MRPLLRQTLSAAIACLVAGAAGAAPTTFIDAANFEISPPPNAYVFTVGSKYETQLGQTLTVEQGGVAVGVYLPFYCPLGVPVVEIRDVVNGEPGNKVLTRARFDPQALPWYIQRNFVYMPFDVEQAAPMGTQFAVVVRSKEEECYFAMSSPGTDYAGGSGWYRHLAYGSQWSPNPAYMANDYPFQLVLRPN